MDSSTKSHVCNKDSIPPDKWNNSSKLNPKELRPICVKILDAYDHVTDRTVYNAELYTGSNDGDINHLTNIALDEPQDISTTKLYTTINLAHLKDATKQTFDMDEKHPSTTKTQVTIYKNGCTSTDGQRD